VLNQTKKELVANLEVGMDVTFPIYNGMFSFSSSRITSNHEYQTAWVMWPYMLAGLACGAWMIVYEGSPFYPDVKIHLKFIDEQKYTPVPT